MKQKDRVDNIGFKLLKLIEKSHTHDSSIAGFIYKVLTNLQFKRGDSLSGSFEANWGEAG
jgi:hypothetical protein